MFPSLVVFRVDGALAVGAVVASPLPVVLLLAAAVASALAVAVALTSALAAAVASALAAAVALALALAAAVASRPNARGHFGSKGQLSEKLLTIQEPRVEDAFCSLLSLLPYVPLYFQLERIQHTQSGCKLSLRAQQFAATLIGRGITTARAENQGAIVIPSAPGPASLDTFRKREWTTC